MKLTVKGPIVSMLKGGTLIQNDPTPCLVEFVFDEAWDGLSKSVRFQAGKAKEVTVALVDDQCRVPEDCLKEGGVPLRIVVDGGSLTSERYTIGRVLYETEVKPGDTPYGALQREIGDPSKLQTESKDLTGAVNELKQQIDEGGTSEGDMTKEVYDPNHKSTDIFKYVDDAVKNVKITMDEAPTEGSENAVTSGGVYEALQNVKIELDPEPTMDSEKAVQSGGVYTALQEKADKAVPSTEGNVAELTADGNLKDSGMKLEDKQDKLTGQQGQVVGFDDAGKAVAAEVGGTNILRGTSEIIQGTGNWSSGTFSVNTFANAKKEFVEISDIPFIKRGVRFYTEEAGTGNNDIGQINLPIKSGETISISFWAKGYVVFLLSLGTGSSWVSFSVEENTENWKRYKCTSICPIGNPTVYFAANRNLQKLYDFTICGIKIERGTVVTDWSPAPEDKADASALDTTNKRVEALEQRIFDFLPHRYVVRWDKKQAKCTRLYDAATISTDATHFCYRGSVDSAYSNPFDDIYPWSHRKLCKVDKAKYKELYEASGDVLESITKWEDDPEFKLGPELPGMDMVYTPEFWMSQWEDGEYVYYGVADRAVEGWVHVHPMVQARYLISQDDDGSVTSIAGSVPWVDSTSIGNLHAEAKKHHLTLDNIQSWCAETMLMVVEYATLNCQTAIGQSVSSLYRNGSDHPREAGTGNTVVLPSAIKGFCIPGAILAFGAAPDRGLVARRAITKVEDAENGYVTVTFSGDPVTYTTSTFCSIHGLYNSPDEAIGSKSGWIGDTENRSLAYYRGRNCYGNAYHYLLGAYREKGTGHIWVAPDEATADSLDALDKQKCIDTGCALPTKDDGGTVQGDGWIKELHLLPDYPCAPFCKTTGGDSNNPVGDFVWYPVLSANDTICIAGARASNGLCVGRFTAYWLIASSNAWWDSAASLAFLFPKGGV